MTYSSDYFLFYAYALTASFAILSSALTIAADAVVISWREWRARKHDGHAFMATKP